MKKVFIKNRKGQKLAVLIEQVSSQKGLAFVMHGLGGDKYQPHVRTFASAFKENGYTVIRFDTANTFGESSGDYTKATVTNYYHDLVDVIRWSKKQNWFHFL